MQRALLDHALAVVREAPLREQPFAHLYFENVFPDDFYESLLACLPEPSRFEPLYHKDALLPNGGTTRSTFTLEPQSLATLPPESREVLEACRGAFASDRLRDALLGRYDALLRQRFASDLLDIDLEVTVKLQRDLPGYRIGVHPDTSDKVVLLQLYLARDDARPSMGTSLYRRSEDGFARVDTLPFRRNCGYSFARTDDSWHGVEPIDAERFSLTVNWRLRSHRMRRAFKKRVLRQLKRWSHRSRARGAARVPG